MIKEHRTVNIEGDNVDIVSSLMERGADIILQFNGFSIELKKPTGYEQIGYQATIHDTSGG